MLEVGKILQDRYRIEKQIGQGGMGSVYLATDKRFNSIAAIKETLFTDDNYRKAFSREARLLNSLKHTALPKVSDTFIDGNGQYIVMEFISGEDLFEMLEDSGEAFPLEDVLIWAEQLLDALEYLHGQENPVIHRDIKPQNLKLTPQGQVILLDFGLAKGNPTDANHHTAANSIFGYSKNYASLEQIQGTGTDPRSDIYSLAATLYHLLTGKPPADALTRVMLVLNEENDPLQPANLIHEQVPEELANFLQASMSLNANLRPQSATEMRELLSGKQKSSVTTRPNTDLNKAVGTNLFTQNTKVFDEKEVALGDSKQSDINTEVLSDLQIASDSIKTKVAKPHTLVNKKKETHNSQVIAPNKNGNRLVYFSAAFGILLLVGMVATMAYLWNSESSPNDINSSIGIANTSANEAALDNSNSNVNLDDSNIFLVEDSNLNSSIPDDNTQFETNPNKTDKSDTSEKQVNHPLEPIYKKETAKSKNKDKDSKISGKNTFESGQIIKTKDVIISDGRVETKDVIIDDNGITLKNTSKSKATNQLPPNYPVTSEQMRTMSPEDQRKVRDALDLKRRMDEKQRRIEREKRLRNSRQPPPPRPPQPF